MSSGAKIFLSILFLGVIAGIAYYFINSSKAAAKPADLTLKGRPTPQASWTQWDWLKNGYTQNEIDAAKAIQANFLTNNLF
jgi:hypothetical protein